MLVPISRRFGLKSLLLTGCIAVSCCFAGRAPAEDFYQQAASRNADRSDSWNSFRVRGLALLNEDRAKRGLSPLALDDRLTQAAQAHSEDMAAKGYFDHIERDGSDPMKRAMKAGIRSATAIGENIAMAISLSQLHAALMNSPGHRANILNNTWTRVGLGVAQNGDGSLLYTQLFGAIAGEYTLPRDYFKGILLDEPLPTTLSTKQAITVSGRVTRRAKNLMLFFLNVDTGEQILFPNAPLALDSKGRFSIKVQLRRNQAGSYQMGLSLDGTPSIVANMVVK